MSEIEIQRKALVQTIMYAAQMANHPFQQRELMCATLEERLCRYEAAILRAAGVVMKAEGEDI